MSDELSTLRAQLSEMTAERDRLRAAVQTVKARVVGDRFPNWGIPEATTRSRSYIADICDTALASTSQDSGT